MRVLFYELLESLRSAGSALFQNRLRALLTTLGIVIGIVMVTATFTTINGIERAFDRSMSMLGERTLFVQRSPWIQGPSDWWKYQSRPRVTLPVAQRMVQYATAQRPDLFAAAAPVIENGSVVRYREREVTGGFIRASTPDFIRVADIDITEGRFYNEIDYRSGARVVVLGSEVAETLFPSESPLGKEITMRGVKFTVIGVLAKQGKFLGLFSFDQQVQVPLTAFQRLFNISQRSFQVHIRVTDGVDVLRAEDELTGLMRTVRGLDALAEDDFSINRSQAFRDQLAATKATIYGIGLFLTALALLVGGIGVMNIMFVSVKERTREIGIRKALGATRRAILSQFLFEAVAICLLGGAIGILGAAGLTWVINQFFTAVLSPATVVLAFAMCVGTGLIFGLAPAWSAAKANPIEALRYE